MKPITTWPELVQIALPSNVKTALLKHLTEPFQTLADAKAYWLESGTQVVIGEVPPQAIPEYIEALPEDYYIQLVITDDSGSGIYYLTKGAKHGN